MIKHDSKFTFRCDGCGEWHGSNAGQELVIETRTIRAAITKARAKRWDILRVRVVSGVPRNKVARTVRRVFCPGCAWAVGVTFR